MTVRKRDPPTIVTMAFAFALDVYHDDDLEIISESDSPARQL
jgi:hypothetical protein